MKYPFFITFFLLAFFWQNTVFANLVPIPQSIPTLKPSVIEQKTKKVFQKKNVFLQNTPSEIYAMTYKWKAIEIFQNTGATIFVQKISFADGGKIGNFFDFFWYDEQTGEPLYSKFRPKDKLSSLKTIPTTVINGQFFDPKRSNTPLSFWLKVKDTILTSGADNGTKAKNIFSYSEKQGARILPYSWESFRDEKSDFVMVNLSLPENTKIDIEDTPRYGRTYMCVLNPDSNGWSNTLLVFTLISHTENEARTIIASWGCQKDTTSMLDSGGSSLIGLWNQIHYGFTRKWTPDMRKIPHLIGFYET